MIVTVYRLGRKARNNLDTKYIFDVGRGLIAKWLACRTARMRLDLSGVRTPARPPHKIVYYSQIRERD